MREAICASLLLAFAVPGLAADEPPGDRRENVSRQDRGTAEEARAQSGAAAALGARVSTAQLRRCEGLDGPRKLACVEAAKH